MAQSVPTAGSTLHIDLVGNTAIARCFTPRSERSSSDASLSGLVPPPPADLRAALRGTRAGELAGVSVRNFGKFWKFCKFLAGSFSAVSKRNFATKYVFDSIFQVLQDLHTFAPLQSQNLAKKSVWKISIFFEISTKNEKFCKICKIILRNFKKFS